MGVDGSEFAIAIMMANVLSLTRWRRFALCAMVPARWENAAKTLGTPDGDALRSAISGCPIAPLPRIDVLFLGADQ
jgi:hypothetical protein